MQRNWYFTVHCSASFAGLFTLDLLTAHRLRVWPIAHRHAGRATVVRERWLVIAPLAAVVKPAQIAQDLVLHLVGVRDRVRDMLRVRVS